jgi:2-oxoglutarate-Fe(II)-dependent dioxygenase family protein
VSDESSHHRSAGHEQVWADLTGQGYALTSDQSLGLPAKFRQNFRDTYFNSWTLRHDEGDWPVDRQRARDVIRYQWRDTDVKLHHHDSITITDRADIPGKRDHSRVELLADAQAVDLIRTFLRMVPPDRRQPDGTFGVNLFRTFTNVVTKPHYDNEEFIIIYVIDRVGEGAETHLYLPDDVTDDGRVTRPAVLEQQLNPGDVIIFEDKRYKHDASPLINPPDGSAMRDALVCTVDYRDTYLA